MAGGILSRVLREVVAEDPIAPLLSDPHYEAIDRRLAIVLHTVDQLIRSSSAEQVLISDGYS
jgi:glycosaminoglycan xylosylkinase